MSATATRTRRPAATPRRGDDRRQRRHSRWVLAGWVTGGLVAVGAAVWVVGWSPLLGVGGVRVVGEGVDPTRVVDAAAVEPGTPLARVDVDGVRSRVLALPRVAEVEVRRGWPRELVIVVTERVPVAAAATASGWSLVDAEGVEYLAVASPPNRLPRVVASGVGRTEAVAALAAMPADVRDRVAEVTATTRDDVTLTLRSGPRVRWGSAERSGDKARVLTAMLALRADAYDVSAPDQPTSTGADRPKGAPQATPATQSPATAAKGRGSGPPSRSAATRP